MGLRKKKDRLSSKKESKTEAVQYVLEARLESKNIHVGPSDYVPWQKDNKFCFLRMEGKLFGDVPMDLEPRLSVEDSPNLAGVVIDAIRCCKLALYRGTGGILYPPSSYFMKHPPEQYPDDEAYRLQENSRHLRESEKLIWREVYQREFYLDDTSSASLAPASSSFFC